MQKPSPIIISKEEQGVLDAFIQSLGNNIKEQTKERYSYYWRRMREDLGGIRPLSQEDVIKFLSLRKTSPARAMLKNWIEFMDFNVKIPKNRGTKARKEVDVLLEDEQIQILTFIDEHSQNKGYVYAYLLIGECALRMNEVININKSDFRWSKWIEEMKVDKDSPCELVITGKGDKERVVIVPKHLALSIVNYIKEKEGDRLFNFGYKKLYAKFNDACKRLGFVDDDGSPRFHPHSLRHTQSTRWFEQGVDMMEIKDRLGHVSIATTQLYINPSKQKAIRNWKDSVK